MDGLVPASEGPYPVANVAMPDQQPQDLPGALALLDSILWRDGGIDQNESQVLAAWVQATQMRMRANQQQQGSVPGTVPNPAIEALKAQQAEIQQQLAAIAGAITKSGQKSEPDLLAALAKEKPDLAPLAERLIDVSTKIDEVLARVGESEDFQRQAFAEQ